MLPKTSLGRLGLLMAAVVYVITIAAVAEGWPRLVPLAVAVGLFVALAVGVRRSPAFDDRHRDEWEEAA